MDDEDEEESDAKRFKEEQESEILFLSNLPASVSEDSLATLFQQYPGFTEVRIVPGKSDIAFVEYNSRINAQKALDGLNGFEVAPGHKMGVAFANR